MNNFDSWNNIKKSINSNLIIPHYKERDVFFIKMGINVGYEENGKGDFFVRPVLILRKFNAFMFWGVPLTTKSKKGKYYYNFNFNNKDQVLILSQLRLFDSKRLLNKIGMISNKDFLYAKEKIKELI